VALNDVLEFFSKGWVGAIFAELRERMVAHVAHVLGVADRRIADTGRVELTVCRKLNRMQLAQQRSHFAVDIRDAWSIAK